MCVNVCGSIETNTFSLFVSRETLIEVFRLADVYRYPLMELVELGVDVVARPCQEWSTYWVREVFVLRPGYSRPVNTV